MKAETGWSTEFTLANGFLHISPWFHALLTSIKYKSSSLCPYNLPDM